MPHKIPSAQAKVSTALPAGTPDRPASYGTLAQQAAAREDWKTAAGWYRLAEEQRSAELALIKRVQEGLSSGLEMHAIYDLVGDSLRDTFDAQVVMISEYDPQTNTVFHHYASERGQHMPVPGWIPVDSSRLAVVRTGKPFLIGSQEINRLLAEEKMHVVPGTGLPLVWLGVPIPVGNIVKGIVSLQNLDREDAFSPSDIELLVILSSSIGLFLENAKLLSDTHQRLAQLAALQETSRAVVSTLDLDELLNLIIDQATTLLQADGGILNMVDWNRWEDEVFACNGCAMGALGLKARLDQDLSGWVSIHNQAVISNQVKQDPRAYHQDEPGVFLKPITNAAFAPLAVKGQVIGTLVVIDKLGGSTDFEQDDLDLLSGFANQAASAIENARLYAAERRRAEQFRLIAEIGRRLTLILDLDELLKQVVALIQETFGYYHVAIGLIEEDEVVYEHGAGELWHKAGFRMIPGRLKIGMEGLSGWVAAHGEPLNIRDVAKEARYVAIEGSKAGSELIVPIIAKDQVIGTLDVLSDHINGFDDTDLLVMQSLAHQVGAAIENVRLFHAEQRRAEQFRVIGEVGRRMVSATVVDELLEQMAQLIQETFAYYHVGIGLVEGGEVVSRAEAGACVETYQGIHIPIGQGAWGWVAQQGEVLMQQDAQHDPHFLHHPGAEGIRSHIGVPLRTKEAAIGVLSVCSDRLNAFDASDRMVLESLAHQAAVAIENIRFHERAQAGAVMEERSRLARELHDAVTQTLFSASLIAEALPATWEKDPREGRALVQELRGLSRGALAEMRTLLLELRPAALAEARLEDLLRQLGEAASGREGIPVDVCVEGEVALPPEVHDALYRIAQEALNNVVKHARASQVNVRLVFSCEDQGATAQTLPGVILTIQDDGRGFEIDQVPHHRLGLGIMKERAQTIGARLVIDSQPGKGTRVSTAWKERNNE